MMLERRSQGVAPLPAWTGRTRRAAVLPLLALAAACGGAEEPEPGAQPAPVAALEPAAASVLREMSDELAEADAFTFDATRRIDAALIEGRNVAEEARIHVMVKRPDKVHAVSHSDEGVRHFYFDGRTATIYDETKKMYARAPVEGTIDDMVERVEARFGFVPPLAEFIVNDPWSKIQGQVRSGRAAGTEVIGGERCRQLQLTGESGTAELWVSDDDELPCRLVATFTEIEGDPKVHAEFSNWNTEAHLTDAHFVFTPPADAREIPMVPVSELEGEG